MHFKPFGLHDYTLKNLMYENNCCKFYDAVDENNTSYVLKFIPSDLNSDEDTLPYIDYFQVKGGVFLVYASNNFAKEGSDYFTYGSGSSEDVSLPHAVGRTVKNLQFLETGHPKYKNLGTKEQKIRSRTSKKSAVTNNSSGEKTPNPNPQSYKELRREAYVGKLHVKSNNEGSSKIRCEFSCPIIETNRSPGLPSILSREKITYPSNVQEKHISIVDPSLQIYHSSHKKIVKTPVPRNSFSPAERYPLKGQNLKCYSPGSLVRGSPECDFKSNIELRLLESSMLQRRHSTQNI
ncbi:Hal1p [Saccharomyces cerevisiae x Saccharomyces kudriavzevii VIN7]|uniref:Hal1p n=1 Tax=Saccharomyces cerevisiae x Saccharomyces kudriavzevii (strain VIN7) TaxID=1095631 RepID=H0H299_SACCK|nr:Hal1p [Saccharomyces cerevisiae x Saccharomyces kudriavzevii VIN7]